VLDVLALILAGGQGDRLSVLSEQRAKPAVVFGGRYRIIDFVLSNVANSGLRKVGVLTQYRPRSLNNHIRSGQAWDLDWQDGGVELLQPYLGKESGDWYSGTADAVYQNLYYIEEADVRDVLILSGDHIYTMQYGELIAFHRDNDADATVGVYEVGWDEASRFGLVSLDPGGRVTDFIEKPQNPPTNLASTGIYVFKKQALLDALLADAERTSSHDFGKDILPAMFRDARVFGYRMSGYWRDVGTIQSYWEANMDLLAEPPPINLYAAENRVMTPTISLPPAKIGPYAEVSRSMLSLGVRVYGTVIHSVLSPGVVVEAGASVRDSIIQHDCVIGRDASVDRCILDKEVSVGTGSLLGYGQDMRPNASRPDIVNGGFSIVGKRTTVPPHFRLGRNVVIGPNVRDELLAGQELESGETVHPTHLPANLFV
jgi:glucose-1-phosphate adenylyltransferase